MTSAPNDIPRDTADSTGVHLRAFRQTDVGVVREHNEDNSYFDDKRGFFIVADGMGGHAAGEVASEMATHSVRTALEAAEAQLVMFTRDPSEPNRRAIVQTLQAAVLAAHQAVFSRGSQEADKAGMGTTLDVVLIAAGEAFVAHVGDSRTYLIRDGHASQITTDHTVAEVLVIEGKLTAEEAATSPLRTVLVNAIGVSADVGVEMAHLQLKPGDRLLLCSDGLHDYFPEESELAEFLTTTAAPDALNAMIEQAKERGGHDNITGIVIEVEKLTQRREPVDETAPMEKPSLLEFADDVATKNVHNARLRRDSLNARPTQPMEAVNPGADIDAPADAADARRRLASADTIPPETRETTPAGPLPTTKTADEG